MAINPDALAASYEAAPELDPNTHLTISRNFQSANDAGDAASSIAAYHAFTNRLQTVQKLSTGNQRKYWGSISPAEQAIFSQFGYNPPPKEDTGILHKVAGAFGSAVHVATTPFRLGEKAISEGFNVLGSGLRFTQHLMRANSLSAMRHDSDMGALSSIGGWVTGIKWGWKDWGQAWRDSEHGESTFAPTGIEHAQKTWGDDTTRYAKLIAAGKAPEEIMAQLNPTERDKFTKMMAGPNFSDAVEYLNASKLSFGRRLFGANFVSNFEGPNILGHHPFGGHTLAGVADAASDIAFDPATWATAGISKANDLKYGMQGLTGDLLQSKFDTYGAVRNAMESAAQHNVAGGAEAVVKYDNRFAPIAELLGPEVKSGQDVLDLYKSVADAGTKVGQGAAIIPGKPLFDAEGAYDLISTSHLPHTNIFQNSIAQGKNKLIDFIDIGNDRHIARGTETLAEQATNRLFNSKPIKAIAAPFKAVFNPLDTTKNILDDAAHIAHRVLTTLPQGTKIELKGPAGLRDIRRLSQEYLPSNKVADVVNDYVNTQDVFGRYKLLDSTIQDVANHAGWAPEQVEDLMASWRSSNAIHNPNANLDEIADAWKNRGTYASNGASMGKAQGFNFDSPLYRHQIPSAFDMPNFQIFRANAEKTKLFANLDGVVNSDQATKFMQETWKPLTLLRFGFPIRVGLDEALIQIMREGPLSYGKSFITRHSVAGEFTDRAKLSNWALDRADSMLEHQPKQVARENMANLQRINDGIMKGTHSDEDLLNAVHKLVGDSMGYRTHKLLFEAKQTVRHGLERLTPQEYSDMQVRMQKYGVDNSSAAKVITAQHGAKHALLADDADQQLVRDVKGGIKTSEMSLKPADDFSDIDIGKQIADSPELHDMSASQMREHLNEFLVDPVANVAVKSIGQNEFDRLAAVSKAVSEDRRAALDAGDFSFPRDHHVIRPGRESVPATSKNLDYQGPSIDSEGVWHDTEDNVDEAIRARAEAIIHDVDASLGRLKTTEHLDASRQPMLGGMDEKPGTTPFDEVIKLLQDGTLPSKDLIKTIPVDALPDAFKVRNRISVPLRINDKIINKGFDKVISPMIDGMARNPAFLHYSTKYYSEFEKNGLAAQMRANGMAEDEIEKTLTFRAMNRSAVEMAKYIHDPEVKSQAASVMRNIMPFWFAQEQFYKRWAKTFVMNPTSFRIGQLMMNGMHTTGWVQQDENGNDYYTYPGAGAFQHILNGVIKHVAGVDASFPVPIEFRGMFKFTVPGLENGLTPGVGPLASIPLTFLANRFPELQRTEQEVLGERGSGRDYIDQILPSSVTRIYKAMTGAPDGDVQVANSMMQAMQYMGAEDLKHQGQAGYKPLLPSQAASDEEWTEFNDRLKQWARILLINRAIYGFMGPTAPTPEIKGSELHSDFTKLLSAGIPINEAQQIFLAAHPNANPYMVFTSQTRGGGYLPATETSMKYINDHHGLLTAYPSAAGFLVPQESDKAEFSQAAYREQMGLGLRERKDWKSIWREIVSSGPTEEYYKSKEAKDAALVNVHGAQAQQIENSWREWKTSFFAMHPIVQADLETRDGSLRRQNAMRELQRALADPRMPRNETTDGVRFYIESYNQYDQLIKQLSTNQSTRNQQQKKIYKNAFAAWSESLADNKSLSSEKRAAIANLYNRIIRPELGVDNG